MLKNKMVIAFNREIMKVQPRQLGLMDPAEMAFSVKALREEIVEMVDAYDRGDLVGVVDALIDLDYFRRGILYKHGITPELYDRLFQAVHHKNMCKELGQPKSSRSELALDAIKPHSWEGPEDQLRLLLEEHMDSGQ